ncbi:hypothetical protein [Singulisphaera sp. GP187]|uniref:hypothetical protein n=1 Tax=Singulisphaera sp. GP187 TaxID=1882752 RepID=UPI0013564C9E|nr:hypothetical protein [Singulisphaera sp. GP187]
MATTSTDRTGLAVGSAMALETTEEKVRRPIAWRCASASDPASDPIPKRKS